MLQPTSCRVRASCETSGPPGSITIKSAQFLPKRAACVPSFLPVARRAAREAVERVEQALAPRVYRVGRLHKADWADGTCPLKCAEYDKIGIQRSVSAEIRLRRQGLPERLQHLTKSQKIAVTTARQRLERGAQARFAAGVKIVTVAHVEMPDTVDHDNQPNRPLQGDVGPLIGEAGERPPLFVAEQWRPSSISVFEIVGDSPGIGHDAAAVDDYWNTLRVVGCEH